jgi:TRAP transporter TAXI family solute receptor
MKTALAACLLAFGLAALPALAQNAKTAEPSPRTLVVGTGGVTGFYFPAGGAVCRVVNAGRMRTGLRCLVESTTGSIHNLNALKAGDLDLAVVQSAWLAQAVKGANVFTVEGPNPNLRVLFALHGEPLTALVRKDSNITDIGDMKKRKVNLGKKGTAQRLLTDLLMETEGWTAADFAQAKELDPDEQLEALCANKIDAAFYVIAHPISIVQEGVTRCNAKLMELDSPKIRQLVAKTPFLARQVIPGGIYPNHPKETVTFGLQALLVADTRLPEPAAHAVVKAVFENFERFQRLHPTFETLVKAEMAQGSVLAPLHDGAARYFRESKLAK